MSAKSEPSTDAAQPKRSGLVSNVISGLATGLFSIPEGMAYAQLANVNPIYGMYSGVVATIAGSLTTGSILMISTLTSAIALATGSVMQQANIQSSQMPQALFTITFLVGAIMFLLGIARLGSIVNFVSNAVMTGFVAGASLLIILGQEHHLTGYSPVGGNEMQKTLNWLENISQWDWTTVGVSVAVIIVMVALKRIRPIEKYAAIIVLFLATAAVNIFGIQTELVSSIATIPNGLPNFMLPDFALVPQLALGAVSVALVALAQGAGISTAVPNPDGSKAPQSRDFVGEGLGNLFGAFFQSMATGGSLSRTGISVGAGANSRWGGVFAGIWLSVILLLFGSSAEKVPLAVIGGMLVVIGVELIMARIPSARLVLRTGDWGPIAAMAITLFSALFIPLQDTIFLGALLSILLYVGASARKFRFKQAVPVDDGGWEMQDVPASLPSGKVTMLVLQGLDFFAEVPAAQDQIPSTRGVSGAVLVLILRDMHRLTSTGILWLEHLAKDLKSSGSRLILADVTPEVFTVLQKSGSLDEIGADNVIPATSRVLAAERTAWDAGQAWLQNPPATEKDQEGASEEENA